MIDLTHDDCIDRIAAGECFHARVDDGAFEVRIDAYVHFAATAIHAGHRLSPDLAGKCALNEAERLYEEDPFTDRLIEGLPITVCARDSRFEYDLNRPPAACIYEEAWGKPVWRTPLDDAQRERSLAKHAAFYQVLGALYRQLEARHPAVLTYDVHSFNYRRPGIGDTPVFNVGTEQIDMKRWQAQVEAWVAALGRISLPGIPVRVAVNEVFYGRGYHATFVREHLRNTLILPSEVKKVFMDETTGTPDPRVLDPLGEQFRHAIERHARAFARDTA